MGSAFAINGEIISSKGRHGCVYHRTRKLRELESSWQLPLINRDTCTRKMLMSEARRKRSAISHRR